MLTTGKAMRPIHPGEILREEYLTPPGHERKRFGQGTASRCHANERNRARAPSDSTGHRRAAGALTARRHSSG